MKLRAVLLLCFLALFPILSDFNKFDKDILIIRSQSEKRVAVQALHLEKARLSSSISLSNEPSVSRLKKIDPAINPPAYWELDTRYNRASNLLLSISGYFRENIGIGLFYSRYVSHASLNAYALSVSQKTFRGPYKDLLSVSYVGPLIGIKSGVWDKDLVFTADLRPGLVMQFDDFRFAPVAANFLSPVFGLGGSVGLEYLLESNFALSLSLNGLYSTIPKLADENLDAGRSDRSLSRIDLNLGIRYRLPNKPDR